MVSQVDWCLAKTMPGSLVMCSRPWTSWVSLQVTFSHQRMKWTQYCSSDQRSCSEKGAVSMSRMAKSTMETGKTIQKASERSQIDIEDVSLGIRGLLYF